MFADELQLILVSVTAITSGIFVALHKPELTENNLRPCDFVI